MNDKRTLKQRIDEAFRNNPFAREEPAPDSVIEFMQMKKSGSRIYWEKVKMPYSEYKREMQKLSGESDRFLTELLEKREKYIEKCRNISIGTYSHGYA